MLSTIPDFSKLIEVISIVVFGIMGVGWGIVKFIQSKRQTDNFIAIHTEIHELLTEIRVQSKAMRVSVLQFHNGEYFMDGISMRKFSITHESSHKGYISQSLKFKNVLCSLFIPLLNKVIENKSTIHHVDAMSESYAKHFFQDENISHYSCLPLKNKNTNIGFILLQWHFDFPPDMENQQGTMDYFENIKNSVELQLSFQKN